MDMPLISKSPAFHRIDLRMPKPAIESATAPRDFAPSARAGGGENKKSSAQEASNPSQGIFPA